VQSANSDIDMEEAVVERLVKYSISLKYEDLMLKVIHQEKHLIIDLLGCGIGALQCVPAKIIRDVASSYTSK
jgi:2-methylcitrate dehydratase PrpD